MSDLVGASKGGERRPMPENVKCPHCGNEIGTIVCVDDVQLLQMGGGLCREWHGVCCQCGYGLHWSISEQMLSSLVRRLLQEQKK